MCHICTVIRSRWRVNHQGKGAVGGVLTKNRPTRWESMEAPVKGVLRGGGKGAGVTQGSTVMRAEAWPKISNLGLLGIKTRRGGVQG